MRAPPVTPMRNPRGHLLFNPFSIAPRGLLCAKKYRVAFAPRILYHI